MSSGVFHQIVMIGATWIFVFLIWGRLVKAFGGIETFIDIGMWIGNRLKSGVVQSAIVSSMIMGPISGSPMANARVTGSFTISLMEKWEIRSETAAIIESVASTGGLVMPPVMGAVAFVMASFLNTNYWTIILAATLPASFTTYLSHYRSTSSRRNPAT